MQPFLYAVRHGQTLYNLNDCLLGHLDPPLIETGIAHARGLAEWFGGKEVGKIYSSPLLRARQTAEAISKKTGVPVVVDPLLIEVNYGDIDGMPIREAKSSGIYAERDRDRMNFRPPNGETYVELTDRLRTFFARERLMEATSPAVLISHQGTARMIAAILGAMSPEVAAAKSIGHDTVLTATRGPEGQVETSIRTVSQALSHEPRRGNPASAGHRPS